MHEGNGQTKKVLPKQLGPLVMMHISNIAIPSFTTTLCTHRKTRKNIKPVFSSVLVKLHLVRRLQP
jgi:hypothetical protein